RPIWSGIPGASTRAGHPAPFPVDIAERLIRMFSFAGDTILDPFAGSGSTTIAAIRTGRNSISIEIEDEYLRNAAKQASSASKNLSLSRVDVSLTCQSSAQKFD